MEEKQKKLSEVDFLRFKNIILEQRLLQSDTEKAMAEARNIEQRRKDLKKSMDDFSSDLFTRTGVDISKENIVVDIQTGDIVDRHQKQDHGLPSMAHSPDAQVR